MTLPHHCEACSQFWPLCMDAMAESMCEICLIRDCQSVSVYVLTCVDTPQAFPCKQATCEVALKSLNQLDVIHIAHRELSTERDDSQL